jgi:hypothetical protein
MYVTYFYNSENVFQFNQIITRMSNFISMKVHNVQELLTIYKRHPTKCKRKQQQPHVDYIYVLHYSGLQNVTHICG